jgi:antitoxin MazE
MWLQGGAAVKARLVQIGNSRGVRIPKPLIQQANLSDEVDLQVRGGSIIISSESSPRSGWAEAAAELRGRGEDKLLLRADNKFDADQWQW